MEDLEAKKLQLLELYFPDVARDVLRDLLSGCNGDIEQVCKLVGGPEHQGVAPSKKNQSKKLSAGQGKITSHIRGPKQILPKASIQKETSSSGPVDLHSPEDVERYLAPFATLKHNFLPEELADSLLDELAAMNNGEFERNRFWLFDRECVSSHAAATFAAHWYSCPKLVYNGVYTAEPHKYSAVFQKAASLLEQYMNETVIPSSKPLKYQHQGTWKSGFCVVNRFDNVRAKLDWHSDRLNHIGPHNFIVSLSLGSPRYFSMRSTHLLQARTFRVLLPHNCFFVMRPGCQEEFKHTVAPMRTPVALHPKYGTLRFSLTFRNYLTEFITNAPRCRCDLPMILQRAFKSKDTHGAYFWLCEARYQNKDCGAFHWADFSNEAEHYVAPSLEFASRWTADELHKQGALHEPDRQGSSPPEKKLTY